MKAFEGDVRDADAVKRWAAGCDRIIHAAAIVPVGQVNASPGGAIAVNVAGTANVAAAAAAANATLTYISTSHVYSPCSAPLSERADIAPTSLYGLTKWNGEQWVQRLTAAPLILRLFSYFDSEQAPTYLVPALHDRVSNAPPNAVLRLFGYDSVRDIADAQWLVERVADLVLTDARGVINVATGKGRSIAAIAALTAASMGREDIGWAAANDAPGDTLIGDVSLMHDTIPVEPFDLAIALQSFAAEKSTS